MREVARRGGDLATMTDALGEVRIPSGHGSGTVRLGDVRDRASLEFSAGCLAQVDSDVFDPVIAGRWLDGYDPERLWPRATCPVLLLQGDPEAGGAFTDEDVAAAQRGLAQSRHVRFEGVGHLIHRTRPEQVLAAIREFAA